MTNYNTDPSTYTIGAAWASSPLGQPGEIVDPTGTYDAVTEATRPKPTARGAAFVAAMLGALAIGPIVGLAVYLYTDSDAARPTAVVPGSGAAPAVPQAPSGIAEGSVAPGTVAASPPEAPAPANAANPNPVVRVPERVVVVPPAGAGRADVGSPPISAPGDTTVIVDIPVTVPTPPSDQLLPPLTPLPPVVVDQPIPPLAPEPEVLAPLPAPGVELPVTPRIVDPPIEAEPPSSDRSFGPRTGDLTLDFDGLSGL